MSTGVLKLRWMQYQYFELGLDADILLAIVSSYLATSQWDWKSFLPACTVGAGKVRLHLIFKIAHMSTDVITFPVT